MTKFNIGKKHFIKTFLTPSLEQLTTHWLESCHMVLDCQKEAGRCGLPLIYKAKHVAEVPQHGINGNSALLPLFLLLATMTSNTVTMQEQPYPCSLCTSPLALCTILARVTAPQVSSLLLTINQDSEGLGLSEVTVSNRLSYYQHSST